MRGLEKIWIIDDEFVHRTYQQYYKEETNVTAARSATSFGFDNFEIRDFSSSRYLTNNRSVAGRILNKFIDALNEHNTLPKLIVFILDDDLVASIPGDAVHYQVQKLTAWLFREVKKALDIYKDYLPNKAKKENYPQFLWIALPMHKNFGSENNRKRQDHADVLIELAKTSMDTLVLKMIKIWDPQDDNSFLYDAYRFPSDGLVKYWSSIDSAIRFWSVAIEYKVQNKKTKIKRNHRQDKFHWSKYQRR